ncbi:MAG: DedA family protein [Patescibacteria group bacterium]|jgi:membrane protein DedA with SNARE-associated domain
MPIIDYLLAGKYLAIFIASILEGPVTMAATGFLWHLGYFQLLPAYLCLLFGDLVGDIIWYYVGYFGGHQFVARFGRFVGLTEELGEKIKVFFRRHDNKILLISKMTMGFGFAVATLVTAGLARVPIKKFIAMNFLGGLIWTALLMALGYFFSNVYLLISEGLRVGFIVFIVLAVVLALYGFNRYIRGQFLKNKMNQL